MNIINIHNLLLNYDTEKVAAKLLDANGSEEIEKVQYLLGTVLIIHDLYADELKAGVSFMKLYNTHFYFPEKDKPKDLPVLKEQVKGLVKTLSKFARSGFKTVDEALQKQRLDICIGCEEITSNFRCSRCGCFMSVKSRIQIATCPLGKW